MKNFNDLKKWQRILVIVGAVFVFFLLVKNTVIKSSITTVGSNVLGAKIKIRSFKLGLITQKVRIKDIVVKNPKGFDQNDPLINIPEVSVDYNLWAMLGGKLHVPLLVLDVEQMTVIKNKEGALNVDALKVAQVKEESKSKEDKEKKTKKASKPVKMQIDEMRLNIDKVVYKDYSQGDQPVVKVYDVGLKDKKFKNIGSAQELAAVILVQGLGSTAIKGAKVYAAATILGVGFLPAGIVGVVVGKDDSTTEYNKKYDLVYQASLDLVKEVGSLKTEDKSKGMIKANINGADVTIEVTEQGRKKTQVKVSARKLMMPKPEIAGGVLHQLDEKLK